MIALVLLYGIGTQLSAPTWYFVLLGVCGIIKLIEFAIKAFNLGRESK